MPRLILPRQLTADTLLSQIDTLGIPDRQVEIDFQHLSFVRPSGMASLAAWVNLLKNSPSVEPRALNAKKSSAFRYLQTMNFWRQFGLFQEEQFTRHPARSRFVRIERIDWDSRTGDLAARLAGVIASESSRIRSPLRLALQESIENMREHAQRPPGYAVAQSYPTTKECEIAIADAGRGVRVSLNENPDYSITNDHTALSTACEKGTSGKIYRRDEATGEPTNHGQGLFEIDRLTATTDGAFNLYSGAASRRRIGEDTFFRAINHWQGTIVNVMLNEEGICEYLNTPPRRTRRIRLG